MKGKLQNPIVNKKTPIFHVLCDFLASSCLVLANFCCAPRFYDYTEGQVWDILIFRPVIAHHIPILTQILKKNGGKTTFKGKGVGYQKFFDFLAFPICYSPAYPLSKMGSLAF